MDDEPKVTALDLYARAVLDRLLADGLVELIEDADPDDLADALTDALPEIQSSPDEPGAALAEWLAENKLVDEVFATDEQLAQVLAQASP